MRILGVCERKDWTGYKPISGITRWSGEREIGRDMVRSLGILEDEDISRRGVMPTSRVVYSILSGRMHSSSIDISYSYFSVWFLLVSCLVSEIAEVLRRGSKAAFLAPKYNSPIFRRQPRQCSSLIPRIAVVKMAFANTLEHNEKIQSIFAREADKRRSSAGIKKAASHGNRKDEKVSTSGLFRRMTTNISRPGDLVLPRESSRKAYIAPLYPNTFSIEATARESSISDDEELVLLATKSANLASKAKDPAILRWM